MDSKIHRNSKAKLADLQRKRLLLEQAVRSPETVFQNPFGTLIGLSRIHCGNE